MTVKMARFSYQRRPGGKNFLQDLGGRSVPCGKCTIDNGLYPAPASRTDIESVSASKFEEILNLQELDTTPWETLVQPSLVSRKINLTTIRGLELEHCQDGSQVRKYHNVRRIATINGTPRQACLTGRLVQLISIRRGYIFLGRVLF